MNILLVNHEFPPYGGGAGQATYNIVKRLTLKGNTVSVLTAKYGDEKKFEVVNGVKIYRVLSYRKSVHENSAIGVVMFIFFGFIKYAKLIRKEKFDAVHTFFTVPSGLIAYFGKKLFGRSYIVNLRGADVPGYDSYKWTFFHRFSRKLVSAVWKNAGCVVSLSKGLANIARNTVDMNFKVIYNGVDTDVFYPVEKICRKDKMIRLVSVSRIVERKGFQYLVEALSDIKTGVDLDFELTVAGVGEYLDELKSLVHQSGIGDNVKFVGYVDNKNLVKLYNSSDIFILPSLTESFGIVFVEAMACGLPVIGTTVGGIPEVVIDGENGILVSPRDAGSLKSVILKLARNKRLRKKMSGKNLESVRENFCWDKVAERFSRVYKG